MQGQNGMKVGSGYTLTTQLGAGNMGEVWRATRHTGEDVAIKLLRSELAKDRDFVQRFLQEAWVLTEIDSLHVVRMYDLVAEGETLALVMELVQGRDLGEYLKDKGTLSAAEATEIMCDVLAGLAAIHGRNIIHRDVKPENVMMDEMSGHVVPKVADLGVAAIIDESSQSRTTVAVGTPVYMSPEVCRGEAPEYASDLYACGIMMYELLTGVSPMGSGGRNMIMGRHMYYLPGRPDGIPDELWNFIEKLTAKDPANRGGTAADAQSWLTSLLPRLQNIAALPKLDEPPEPIRLNTHDHAGGTVFGTQFMGGDDSSTTEKGTERATPEVVIPGQSGQSPTPTPHHTNRNDMVVIGASAMTLVLGAVTIWYGSGLVEDYLNAGKSGAGASNTQSLLSAESQASREACTNYRDADGSPISPDDVDAPTPAKNGEDGAGRTTTYYASNMFDGTPTTAWRVPGDGSGDTITMRWDQPVTICTVGLINGYAKTDRTDGNDRYFEARKITSATWTAGSTTVADQNSLSTGDRTVQTTALQTPVTTSELTLRINDTSRPGRSSRDYTTISEIEVVGFIAP